MGSIQAFMYYEDNALIRSASLSITWHECADRMLGLDNSLYAQLRAGGELLLKMYL